MPFNGTQFRVILAIVRLTWGWGKETKTISYGYLAKEANLDKRNVRRAVDSLVRIKVIVKNKNGFKNRLGINRDYGAWNCGKLKNPEDAITLI